MIALIVSILAILAENNCLTEEVYLAVTFSKICIDIYIITLIPFRYQISHTEMAIA